MILVVFYGMKMWDVGRGVKCGYSNSTTDPEVRLWYNVLFCLNRLGYVDL